MDGPYVLYGEAGSGSVAIEAALTLIGAPYESVETNSKTRLGNAATPLAQVPALRLPDGRLMTESAAILLWLAETHAEAGLAPAVGTPERAAFLRWMSFVACAIYAHYWARDDTSRVTADPAARKEVKAALDQRIADAWGVMEAGLQPGRYLLGDRLTVLDLYVTVVSRWTPRGPLHEKIAPRLAEVVRRVETDRRLTDLWGRRFPLDPSS